MTGRWPGGDPPGVSPRKPERPYLEAWLRRISRQFAASGRLSQAAAVLAREDGGCADAWCARLRRILDGDEIPTIELLTRIDGILAKPGTGDPDPPHDAQGTLF